MKTPLEIAKMELGIREVAGPKSNQRILEYHQHTSLKADDESVPWCSSFICFCIDKAIDSGWKGSQSTNKAWARSYLSWGKSSKKAPKTGDIAVFSRGASKSSGHVALFLEFTKLGTMVKVIGGNQSDAVTITEYPRWRLLDIRRG